MGAGPVPDLPSLFLLPNSLVDQTIREFKAFQQFHSVDIQRIPSQVEKASEFLKETFMKSPHPPIRRIAVMSHSVSNPLTLFPHTFTEGRNAGIFRACCKIL